MKIVAQISKYILNAWKKQIYFEYLEYRPIIYLREIIVDEGVLLYNVMTNEIILIDKDEYQNFKDGQLKQTNFLLYRFLIRHWFLIPVEYSEKTMVYLYRNINYREKILSKTLNHYVILTTTDCNARCYYCFEMGVKRIQMSKQTAEDVAKYIVNKSDPTKEIKISWFGGEPLFNYEVIDIISKYVIDNGFKLRSSMISNGYLIDNELINKATNLWNLKNIQITLDGTESVYNKTKAYIYKNDENPFEKVLNNIELLLKNNIRVSIRCNLGTKNYLDLYNLIDIINERFHMYKGMLSIDIAIIYENIKNNLLVRSNEQRKFIYDEAAKLEEHCDKTGLLLIQNIDSIGDIKYTNCMADSPNSVLISPEGNLGSCEHFVGSDFHGSIYDESTLGKDYSRLRDWKDILEEMPECSKCFYYPKCYRLKGCETIKINDTVLCEQNFRKIDRSVLKEYDKYKQRINKI